MARGRGRTTRITRHHHSPRHRVKIIQRPPRIVVKVTKVGTGPRKRKGKTRVS